VVPEKLQSEGFDFGYPDVSMALKDILQKKI
jgi:NAD dependent epimerase/dehydratase family enzyme